MTLTGSTPAPRERTKRPSVRELTSGSASGSVTSAFPLRKEERERLVNMQYDFFFFFFDEPRCFDGKLAPEKERPRSSKNTERGVYKQKKHYVKVVNVYGSFIVAQL